MPWGGGGGGWRALEGADPPQWRAPHPKGETSHCHDTSGDESGALMHFHSFKLPDASTVLRHCTVYDKQK